MQASFFGALFVLPCLLVAFDALSDGRLVSVLGAEVAAGRSARLWGLFFLILAGLVLLAIFAFWDAGEAPPHG